MASTQNSPQDSINTKEVFFDSAPLIISNQVPNSDFKVTDSLENLQTTDQRRVLDTIAQIRKVGLDSFLSLPQIVVCGDQSAGKSSVLEALTEIPFPRSDNLCTRHATEIILRRASISSITVKVIPGSERPNHEQIKIKDFTETITNFEKLPLVMDNAKEVMGITADPLTGGAFAPDVLSITMEGPNTPQLTLVDIPGLIANATKGVTDADVKMVAEITDRYISQPRTICLAVISATNDHANQPILTKIRNYDPQGDRTLGVITKPDCLPVGSGSESSFISLAKNEDVYFRLGWHVLKNRSFEEADCNLISRNISEASFFRTSNFKCLPSESLGIASLQSRLSLLLFEHVKLELPKLRQELEDRLADYKDQLNHLGIRRSTPEECKSYLSQLSLVFYEICKAAVDGNYAGEYFLRGITHRESHAQISEAFLSRVRAHVQSQNAIFADYFRMNAHKFQIEGVGLKKLESSLATDRFKGLPEPKTMTKKEALDWVSKVIARTRGRELIGNYNPLVVGELFWEQSFKWEDIAIRHIEETNKQCRQFIKTLLHDKCPKDVASRLWDMKIHDSLHEREICALEELGRIMEDLKGYPINYNHHYTSTINERRETRRKAARDQERVSEFSTPVPITNNENLTAMLFRAKEEAMEEFSCQESLDCLLAIYKVQQKTFIANITTQVIERHIIRGLEKIFSPVVVNAMTDSEVKGIAGEPESAKLQRNHIEGRIKRLQEGERIFKGVMGY